MFQSISSVCDLFAYLCKLWDLYMVVPVPLYLTQAQARLSGNLPPSLSFPLPSVLSPFLSSSLSISLLLQMREPYG